MLMQKKTVHFIIPCYKGRESIKKCLDSIQNQTYPKEYIKISVIENGPRDQIEAIAASYQNCFYHYNPKKGRSEARNYLLDQITSDFIAYIDVDVELSSNWLEESLLTIQSPYCAAVTGPVYKNGNRWIDQFRKSIANLTTDGASNILENPFVLGAINTAASLFRTSALKAVGGFDTSFKRSEDYELTHRLLRSGYTLATTGKATAIVDWDRGAFEYFVTRFFQMGYYSSKAYYKHGLAFTSFLKGHTLKTTKEKKQDKNSYFLIGWPIVNLFFISGQFIGRVKFKSTPLWNPYQFKKKLVISRREKNFMFELNPKFEILTIRGDVRLYSREKKSFLQVPDDVKEALGKILKNPIYNINEMIDELPISKMIDHQLLINNVREKSGVKS